MHWQWSLRGFFLAIAAVGLGLTVTKLHVADTPSIGRAEALAYGVWATVSFLIAASLLRASLAQGRKFLALRGDDSAVAFAALFQAGYQFACAALVPLGFAVSLLPMASVQERYDLWYFEPAMLHAGVVFGALATAPLREGRKRGGWIVDSLVVVLAVVAMCYHLMDDLLIHFLVFLAVHSVELGRHSWQGGPKPTRFPGDEMSLVGYQGLALVAGLSWLLTFVAGFVAAKGQTSKVRILAWMAAVAAGLLTAGLVGWHARYGLSSLSSDFAESVIYQDAASLLGLLLVLLAASFLAFRSSLTGKRMMPEADGRATRYSAAACGEGAGSSWLMASYLASWAALFGLVTWRQNAAFASLTSLPINWADTVVPNPTVWLMLAMVIVLIERAWYRLRGVQLVPASELPLDRARFVRLWCVCFFCLLTAVPLAGWIGLALNLELRR